MKKTAAVITLLMLLAAVPAAFAGHGKTSASGKQDLTWKICAKAQMIMDNGEEAGLSPEAVQKAKDLKMKAKRIEVKKNAEIELAALDVKEALYVKGAVDMKKVNALIDAKYALKNDKAKQLAAIYAELKSIPSAEQWKEMKEQKKRAWMGMRKD